MTPETEADIRWLHRQVCAFHVRWFGRTGQCAVESRIRSMVLREMRSGFRQGKHFGTVWAIGTRKANAA